MLGGDEAHMLLPISKIQYIWYFAVTYPIRVKSAHPMASELEKEQTVFNKIKSAQLFLFFFPVMWVRPFFCLFVLNRIPRGSGLRRMGSENVVVKSRRWQSYRSRMAKCQMGHREKFPAWNPRHLSAVLPQILYPPPLRNGWNVLTKAGDVRLPTRGRHNALGVAARNVVIKLSACVDKKKSRLTFYREPVLPPFD